MNKVNGLKFLISRKTEVDAVTFLCHGKWPDVMGEGQDYGQLQHEAL